MVCFKIKSFGGWAQVSAPFTGGGSSTDGYSFGDSKAVHRNSHSVPGAGRSLLQLLFVSSAFPSYMRLTTIFVLCMCVVFATLCLATYMAFST